MKSDPRRGRFEEVYRAVAAAPYDFRLWDEPAIPTAGLDPMPTGYGNPERWLAFMRKRKLQALGGVVTLGAGSRHPTLHSSAPAPFVVDGLRCASLDAFYRALQIPDPDQRRAFALEPFALRRRPAKTFFHRDEAIEVWSIDHDTLIARAVEAKVMQNPAVRDELASTGRAPIYIGEHFMDRRFDEQPGGLWRAMPLALMLVRARV